MVVEQSRYARDLACVRAPVGQLGYTLIPPVRPGISGKFFNRFFNPIFTALFSGCFTDPGFHSSKFPVGSQNPRNVQAILIQQFPRVDSAKIYPDQFCKNNPGIIPGKILTRYV
jgi:hypothetical protein